MINKISRFIKDIKKSSFKKEREQERRRLFFRPVTEKRFKKRKKYTIEIPNISRYFMIDRKYWKFIYLGVILLLLSAGLFAVYGPIFRVKHIEIIKKEDITNINIAYRSVEDIRDTPMFTLNAKEAAERLKWYQKNIKEVSIKKELPDTLKISIESYKAIFRVIINEKEYTVTENGVLIPWKVNTELPLMKFVERYSKASWILDYKQAYNPQFIKSIVAIYEKLWINLLGIEIDSFYYFPQERELHIDFSTGNKVIFDLNENTENQIKKLLIFHTEQYDLKQNTMVYIDLRVKWKIFFCTTENEYQCKLNLSKIYGY